MLMSYLRYLIQTLVIRCSNVQDVVKAQSIVFSAFAKIVLKHPSLRYHLRNKDPRTQKRVGCGNGVH